MMCGESCARAECRKKSDRGGELPNDDQARVGTKGWLELKEVVGDSNRSSGTLESAVMLHRLLIDVG
jgi:hypothetical protein